MQDVVVGRIELAVDVNQTLSNFRDMLNAGYPSWRRSAEAQVTTERRPLDEIFSDWTQAIWELLVERTLCPPGEFLQLYDSGSDYEEAGYSRVFFHDAGPTHELVCESAAGTVVDVLSGAEFHPDACVFERFVANIGEWFADEPPFDHVLLRSGNTLYMTSIADVVFVKHRLRDAPSGRR
jgi:hypothetical protein